MSKSDMIEVEGTVVEVLPNTTFKEHNGLYKSITKLADKYNVSKGTIAGVIQGRTWKNVQ